MSERDHDDGLVHEHRWAYEAEPMPRQATPMVHRPAPEIHDDGLVHEHGWASAERSRMAQPD